MAKRTNDISVRLSVEDAEKARAALLAFGKDGQKALEAIDRAAKPASGGLTLLDSTIGGLTKRMPALLGALAVAAGPAALVGLTKRALEAADVLADTADKIGVSVEALQELRYAAKETGGSVAVMDASLEQLTKRVGEAAAGQGELRDVLRQYGITLKDAQGNTRSTEAVLGDLAEAVKGAGSAAERSRIVFAGFGRAGGDMVNLLAKGRDGVADLANEAHKLGIVMQEQMVRNAADASDALERMGTVIEGNLNTALVSLSPLIEDATNAFSRLFAMSAEGWGLLGQRLLVPIEKQTRDSLDILVRDINNAIGDLLDERSRLEGALADGGAAASGHQARQRRERLSQIAAELKEASDNRERAIARIDAIESAAAERRKGRGDKGNDVAGNAAIENEKVAAAKRLADLEGTARKAVSTPIQQALDDMRQANAGLDADYAKNLISYEKMMAGKAAALTIFSSKEQDLADAAQKTAADGAAKAEDAWRGVMDTVGEIAEKRAKDDEDAARQLAEFGDAAVTPVQASLRKIQRAYADNLKIVEGHLNKGLITEAQAAQARADLLIGYEKEIQEAQEKTFGEKASQEATAYFKLLGDAGGRAGGFLVGQIRNMEDALTGFFETGKFNAESFFNAVKGTVARTLAQDVMSGVGGLFGGSGGTVTGGFLSGLFGGGASAVGSSVGSSVGGFLSDVGSSIAGFFGFADGGLVRGPGTSTSDSIEARLSDGEFVVNAKAARRNLPLLRQLNAQGRGGFMSARRRRGFAWGGASDDYGDSDAFGSDYGGSGGGLTQSQREDRFGGGNDQNGGWSNDDMARPGEVVGNGVYSYNEGGWFSGRSWSFTDPDSGIFDARVEFGNRLGAPSATGLREEINPKTGSIVDREGGTFAEKIGTFFGAGTTHGFLGSMASSVLATLLGGLVGGLPGLALGFGANTARSAATAGEAWQSPGGVGELADRLGEAFSGGSSAQSRATAGLAAGGAADSGPGRSLPANPNSVEREGGDSAAVVEAVAGIAAELRNLRRELAQRDDSFARFAQMFGGALTPRRNDVF